MSLGLEAEGDRAACPASEPWPGTHPRPRTLQVPQAEEAPWPADPSSPSTGFLPPLGLAWIRFLLTFPFPPPQLQDSPEGMICPKQDPSVLLHRGPDSSRAHLECVPHPSRVSCSLKRGPRAGGTRRGTASVSEVRQGLHTDTFHGRSNTPVPTVPFSPVVRDGTARLLES